MTRVDLLTRLETLHHCREAEEYHLALDEKHGRMGIVGVATDAAKLS